MNKKGFTLVELMATLVILGIIVVIIVPSTVNIIKTSKKQSNESQKALIIEAAKTWLVDNDNIVVNSLNGEYKLNVATLKNGGYLKDSDIKNIEKNININNACVKIKSESDKYTYTFVDECI